MLNEDIHNRLGIIETRRHYSYTLTCVFRLFIGLIEKRCLSRLICHRVTNLDDLRERENRLVYYSQIELHHSNEEEEKEEKINTRRVSYRL